MGNEVLPSDLDADIDFSDESTRRLYAQRLASEITGEMFVRDENARSGVLDRDAAVRKLEKVFKAMHNAEEGAAGRPTARGVRENQLRFEAVAGRPLDEALEEAAEEYEEYEVGKIAKWLVG